MNFSFHPYLLLGFVFVNKNSLLILYAIIFICKYIYCISYLFNYIVYFCYCFVIFGPLAAGTNTFPRLRDIKGLLIVILIFTLNHHLNATTLHTHTHTHTHPHCLEIRPVALDPLAQRGRIEVSLFVYSCVCSSTPVTRTS